jgi:uncharacterized glyoxalase superfamily protein PhnB
MLVNRSRPPREIIPTLYYDDVAQALDWLCGAFGFIERFRYGHPDNVGGAQLSTGTGTVMLSRARVGQSPDWSDNAAFGPPRDRHMSILLSVHVRDIDAHFEKAQRFGARIIHPPETYRFGERQYTAEDLAGHRWSFSQTVADVTPEDWGGTSHPGLRAP